MIKSAKTIPTLIIVLYVSVITGNAQWVNSPAENTKLVVGLNDPVNISALEDKNGGVFVFWEDKKLENINGVYFIHADKHGKISFRADGKSVSKADGAKEQPVAITDAEGNAYVLFKHSSLGKLNRLFVQKLSRNGSRLWGDNGVEVSKNDLEIIDYSFDINKNGMLIVSYIYREPGFTGDYIVAYQFIDQLGNLKHMSYDESLLFTSNNRKSKTSVLVDFENGAFFFWMENFSGKSILRSLFIDETGLKIWGKEPVNISNINKSVLSYNVNRFGNSVYLSFQYQGQIKDIHHQLITRNGNLVWGTVGKKISNMNGSQLNPQTAIIDSTIYLTWTNEFRNSKDIFVQKFDTNGKAYWKKEGIPVIKSVSDQFGQKIIHDQKGNLIIAWINKRADSVYGNIYVQKIDSKGQVIWDSLSVTIGSFHNSHKSYINLLPDGSGGAIVVFKEKRNGKNELFAQKVFETGTFASQILAFTADKVDDKIKLSWYSANESPNVTYNIERTVQADTGLADWNRIGTVEITENRSVNYYEFFDVPDTVGTLYYRIIQNNGNNEESVYDVVKLNYLETAESIILTQNSPNPFTDSTMISFYLPYDEDITLEFFDSKVEVIKKVPKQKYLAGQHEIIIKSDELKPGIYFYRFKAGNHIEVKKMVVSTR